VSGGHDDIYDGRAGRTGGDDLATGEPARVPGQATRVDQPAIGPASNQPGKTTLAQRGDGQHDVAALKDEFLATVAQIQRKDADAPVDASAAVIVEDGATATPGKLANRIHPKAQAGS
jgi:hypothetical protein